jgi:serine/threonine protein kinase
VYSDLEHPTCVIKTPRDDTVCGGKIHNEKKILDILRNGNVEFVPRVEGLLANSLKLSPLGIPVSSYVKCSSMSALPVDLLRLMGPMLIRTLQHAHSLKVAHRDIRRENLLIVLPVHQQSNSISYTRELGGVGKLLNEVKLAECAFYLNDWGEAISEAGKVHFKIDLHELVGTLLNIHKIDDFCASRSSSSSKKTAKNTSGGDGSGAGNDVYTSTCSQLASSLNYDGLISFFANL